MLIIITYIAFFSKLKYTKNRHLPAKIYILTENACIIGKKIIFRQAARCSAGSVLHHLQSQICSRGRDEALVWALGAESIY